MTRDVCRWCHTPRDPLPGMAAHPACLTEREQWRDVLGYWPAARPPIFLDTMRRMHHDDRARWARRIPRAVPDPS